MKTFIKSGGFRIKIIKIMNLNDTKIEIASWILNLNDLNVLNKLVLMRKYFSLEVQEKKKEKKQREFGCGKGIFTYIADDFNAPLEMFKEYSK